MVPCVQNPENGEGALRRLCLQWTVCRFLSFRVVPKPNLEFNRLLTVTLYLWKGFSPSLCRFVLHSHRGEGVTGDDLPRLSVICGDERGNPGCPLRLGPFTLSEWGVPRQPVDSVTDCVHTCCPRCEPTEPGRGRDFYSRTESWGPSRVSPTIRPCQTLRSG